MLGTVLHLHRGTPYVYQGEELGMTNAPFNAIDDFRDIESLNHYAEAVGHGAAPDDVLRSLRTMGRDNARTPMQWDAVPHAGFTTGEPWLGVNPNHAEINAEAARADPDSVFHHYRQLIELRHAEPVVAHGDFTMLLADDERVYAFTRSYEGVELLVLGNFSGDEVTVDLPGGRAPTRSSAPPGIHPRPMGRAGMPNSRNCVNCAGAKLSSLTSTTDRRPSGSRGPNVMPSTLSSGIPRSSRSSTSSLVAVPPLPAATPCRSGSCSRCRARRRRTSAPSRAGSGC